MNPTAPVTGEIMSESIQGSCRLYIKAMAMENFKSFARAHLVGPLHQSFSVITSANKSDVIDAMLFVFGKRSKQMCLNKVSELIHNSTNSACVSIHFQEIIDLDDGTYEVVPGSDFVIAREAFRDNSSKYYINSLDSKFSEVTKKLKGKGVDLDNNRFLIFQGEVEQISLMKPKVQGPHDEGFLEYLEDIIGTNKYVEKIDEASKQLESLNKKRYGVVQMVKLAEKERESLEGIKNEAEDYLLKELLLLNWQEVAAKLASVDNTRQIGEIKANVSTLEENLKSDKKKIQENRKKMKQLEALQTKYMKRHEELDNALKRCEDQFKELNRQNSRHHEILKHVNSKINQVDEKLEMDLAKITDITKQCEKSRELILKLEDEDNIFDEIWERVKVELMEVIAELEPWEKLLIVHKLKLEVAYTERKFLAEKAGSQPSKHELEELGKVIVKEENVVSKLTQRSKELKRKASELQIKRENAGFKKLKSQMSKVNQILTDLGKISTQIDTGQNMIKILNKGIEDSKKKKERLDLEKEDLPNSKEIEHNAFSFAKNYMETQESIGQQRDAQDKFKSDYESLKKTDELLHATEVDTNFELEDMKKILNDLEVKGNEYSKKLKDLPVAISKHMEQIKKYLVDPEKLQETLGYESLAKVSNLRSSLKRVALLEAQLKNMNPNLDSIAEYRKNVSLYNERAEELNTVTQERDDTNKQLYELRKKRLDEFLAGFNSISLKLKEIYQMITLGGDAELELVDSLDPFSNGVVFRVRPPKKSSWKNIANLSGVEKTLCSLALVFALHHYKPTPLCVMDEITAALATENLGIVGYNVKDRTKDRTMDVQVIIT